MTTSTDTPTSPSPDRLSDAALAGHVVDTLDAALSSAAVDVIGVAHWWDRATAALQAAGAAGSAWPRVCSTLARKLQIDVYTERDARRLTTLGGQLDTATLARWCHLAQRDTPYLVAMCRVHRAERTTARARPAGPTAPAPDLPA